MKQQSMLDRYLYFGRKKIAATLHGLTASAIRGRFAGPRVLMNSIPKAGTNMLERTLDRFRLLRNTGMRTLRGWSKVDRSTLSLLRGIKKGQFRSAHLPAHEVVLSIVNQEDLKVLFMVRDPRDIAVSYIRYVTSIDLTHKAHAYFNSLPDDDARLMAAILGIDGIVSPLAEVLARFEGWLDDRNTLVIRFEDLVGERGGGSREAQRSCVKKIAGHLDIGLKEKELEHICNNIYSSKTLTFRKGEKGGWKKAFKQDHITMLKENAGNLLARYGYGD